MKTPNPRFYKQDEDGQWWYYPGRDRHRTRTHDKVCEGCGDAYVINAYHAARSRFCSRSCAVRTVGMIRRRGERHPNWKGGRHHDQNGYILVYAPEHPTVYVELGLWRIDKSVLRVRAALAYRQAVRED